MKKVFLCLLLAGLTAALIHYGRRGTLPVIGDSAQAPAPYAELAQMLEVARKDPALSGAAIGFCLLNAQGEVVFEDQSRTAFIPASTLKTLTTATALENWGPDFHIDTELRSTAPIQDGQITGDVVLRGGADPMLSLSDLQSWAQTLRRQGLTRITGRIIGDGRLLPGSLYDDFWDWGDIGNGYGSGVSGLNLEHNRFVASFRPGIVEGLKATLVEVLPEVPGIHWINEVTTGAADSGDGVVIHGGEHTQTMHLRGTVPVGGGDLEIAGAVSDPELYAAHHLRALLIAVGIAVEGTATTASQLTLDNQPVPEAKEMLVKHASPRLIEIITSIHATSDNHETECLFRLLGQKENKPADEVVREHWEARGLTFEGLRMEDGCGLARADFIRPVDLARLQHLAGSGPHGELYRRSLLSSPDGTLRWKGGAMSGVRSYTGFVKGASGVEFTFALMVNHFRASDPVATLREAMLSQLRAY